MYRSSNYRGGRIRPSAGRNLVVAFVSALAVLTAAPTLRGQGRQEPSLTDAEGTLEVLSEDNGGSRLHHFLRTPAWVFAAGVRGRAASVTDRQPRAGARQNQQRHLDVDLWHQRSSAFGRLAVHLRRAANTRHPAQLPEQRHAALHAGDRPERDVRRHEQLLRGEHLRADITRGVP